MSTEIDAAVERIRNAVGYAATQHAKDAIRTELRAAEQRGAAAAMTPDGIPDVSIFASAAVAEARLRDAAQRAKQFLGPDWCMDDGVRHFLEELAESGNPPKP